MRGDPYKICVWVCHPPADPAHGTAAPCVVRAPCSSLPPFSQGQSESANPPGVAPDIRLPGLSGHTFS